jgi:hypothetical protein
MLKWPARANAAIRKLFEPLQDIDVYVEDLHDEAFYRCLLVHATKRTVRIARVFALNGRQPVIDAARVYDQRTRPALFIIDGDLPLVKGEAVPSVVGLHCHDAYCVENLLLCEKAISLILSQEIVVSEEDASALLDYDRWRRSVITPLIELFAAFATVHDYDPTVATVAQGVGVMCFKHRTTKITKLDPAKVRRAKDRALAAAEAASDAAITAARYKGLLSRIKAMPDPLLAVSGKDFLIPLIDFHLQSLGCHVRRKSLRVRLASEGDMGRFSKLAAAVTGAARGFK